MRPECAVAGLTWGGRYVTAMVDIPVIAVVNFVAVSAVDRWWCAGTEPADGGSKQGGVVATNARPSYARRGCLLSMIAGARLLYQTIAMHAMGYFACGGVGSGADVRYALVADRSLW